MIGENLLPYCGFESVWKMGIFSYDSSYAEEFWRQNVSGGGCYCATLVAFLVIFVWHFVKSLFFSKSSPTSIASSGSTSVSSVPLSVDSQSRIQEIVSNEDLKGLIENLDGNLSENEKWEDVINKRNDYMSYNAKCCKPKVGPLKYLSVTVFENCSPEVLRDFYMDNDYRKQWDRTMVDHEQLQLDTTNGIEFGRTIKKFPLLTPREYVLAWRLWEGKENTFYCFIKECEHPSVQLQKKYVRVSYFRSGWRIRKVPGRNASQIVMVHQEDAGLNVEMAKLAFSRGIWSFVCKMDNALRKYSTISHPQTCPASAVTLIKKVPSEFEKTNTSTSTSPSMNNVTTTVLHGFTDEAKCKKFLRRPSKKFLTNSLLLLGGAVCLSRGHSTLGVKVAMAYFLTKMRKLSDPPNQSSEN